MLLGRAATFEEIQNEISNLNIGEFVRFCVDFTIPLTKANITAVFKRCALNSKEMFFDHFIKGLEELFREKSKVEVDDMNKRVRALRF